MIFWSRKKILKGEMENNEASTQLGLHVEKSWSETVFGVTEAQIVRTWSCDHMILMYGARRLREAMW